MELHIGDFEVKGNTLIVSDPYYDPNKYPDNSQRAVIRNVVPGMWQLWATVVTTGFGKVVAELQARHATDACYTTFEYVEDLPVDSGRMSVADAKVWSSSLAPHLENNYKALIDIEYDFGVIRDNRIAVTFTGHGDGSYPCSVQRRDGKVYTVKVQFVDELY